MSSKIEKIRRKKKLKKLKQQQLSEEMERMPLSQAELKSLFDWVEARLIEQGCDHTLRHSEHFLSVQRLPIEEVTNWLQAYGGYCDCEVIANVEDKWGEIVGSI
ncbi:MAG: DUF2695 domain-containing protein [Chloroflexota bacterium]